MEECSEKLAKYYEETKLEDYAEILILLYANIHNIRLGIYVNEKKVNEEVLNLYEGKIKQLYEQYQDNDTFAEAYLSVRSHRLTAIDPFKHNLIVPDELYNLSITCRNKWNDSFEIAESLARLLCVKISILSKEPDKNKKNIEKLIDNLETLATETNHLYKNQSCNEIEQMLDSIYIQQKLLQLKDWLY